MISGGVLQMHQKRKGYGSVHGVGLIQKPPHSKCGGYSSLGVLSAMVRIPSGEIEASPYISIHATSPRRSLSGLVPGIMFKGEASPLIRHSTSWYSVSSSLKKHRQCFSCFE